MLTVWIGWAGSLCLASPACSNQCSGHQDVDKFQHLLQTHIDFSRLPSALSLPAQAFQFDCIDFCSFCDTGLKLYCRPASTTSLASAWLEVLTANREVAMAVRLTRAPPLLLNTCIKVYMLPHWKVHFNFVRTWFYFWVFNLIITLYRHSLK